MLHNNETPWVHRPYHQDCPCLQPRPAVLQKQNRSSWREPSGLLEESQAAINYGTETRGWLSRCVLQTRTGLFPDGVLENLPHPPWTTTNTATGPTAWVDIKRCMKTIIKTKRLNHQIPWWIQPNRLDDHKRVPCDHDSNCSLIWLT